MKLGIQKEVLEQWKSVVMPGAKYVVGSIR